MNRRTCIRRDELRRLRNQIDFKKLFRHMSWPWKPREDGVIQFICPRCSERQTSVNPKTNLARCFRCEINWNPIDFVMEVNRMDFLESVGYLQELAPDDQADT
jgi:DNA primase